MVGDDDGCCNFDTKGVVFKSVTTPFPFPPPWCEDVMVVVFRSAMRMIPRAAEWMA